MEKQAFTALNSRMMEEAKRARKPKARRSTRARSPVRQSAQRCGRLAAAEGRGGHRRAAAALLRPWLGRGVRAAGGDPVRDDARIAELGLAGLARHLARCRRRSRRRWRITASIGRAARGAAVTTSTAWSTKSTGSTGSARLGQVAQGAALGARPQIPRRARRDHARGDRHPGRPHRQADPGRRGWSRCTVGGVVVTNATLHNRDEIARLGVRDGRPRRHPARRRRDPAGRREPDADEPRATPYVFPDHCPVCGSEAVARGRRGRRALHRRPDLPGAAVRAAAPFRQPRRARHRGARREDHRRSSSSSAGWKGPADIFRLHEHRDDLVGREGWQDKSVDNLFAAIEAKRAPRRGAAAVRPRHPPCRQRHRARPAAGASARCRALREAAEAARAGDDATRWHELTGDRRRRPGGGRGARRLLPRAHNREVWDDLLGEVVAAASTSSRRRERRSPARPWCSPARSRP